MAGTLCTCASAHLELELLEELSHTAVINAYPLQYLIDDTPRDVVRTNSPYLEIFDFPDLNDNVNFSSNAVRLSEVLDHP